MLLVNTASFDLVCLKSEMYHFTTLDPLYYCITFIGVECFFLQDPLGNEILGHIKQQELPESHLKRHNTEFRSAVYTMLFFRAIGNIITFVQQKGFPQCFAHELRVRNPIGDQVIRST